MQPKNILNTDSQIPIKAKRNLLLFVGSNAINICDQLFEYNYTGLSLSTFSKTEIWLKNRLLDGAELPVAIISDFALQDGNVFSFHYGLKLHEKLRNIPLIVIAKNRPREDKIKALKVGIDDFYINHLNAQQIHERIQFLEKFKKLTAKLEIEPEVKLNHFLPSFKMPVLKRAFDIASSFMALVILSPLFLLIALLIKIESKGPVFYISLRAGAGYKIFNFYKFRTMKLDADKELNNMIHLNQYKNKVGTSFVKFNNDPRVTRLGKVLRRMSLDELPQLINVLIGDMSLVGNRPLPLYEAEKLTKDQFAKRFLAPAGITGLWQISKKRVLQLSDEERMNLDIAYADQSSFLYDLKILFKTIPVVFHHAVL
jgi:lipopolysaccharide/colanic/teichoic acid biosynthesis glycosyltransferase